MTALYERYRDDVFVYCQRRLRNREEAEDATQVTFLKALTGLRNGAVPQVENAWLFTIAKRVVLTRLEVTNRLRAIETKAELDAVAENRGDALERAEMDELWKAVEALPETARRAFLMREWQGLQYDEIAEALGLDKSHVGVMLLRARRRVVATVQTSGGRVRSLFNVGSFSGLVRRVADLFSGNASHLLLAATTIASPVGALGMPSSHAAGPVQRVVSASAVSEVGPGGTAPASSLASLESPRPFIVPHISVVAQRRGVSPSVGDPSASPAGPGTSPGEPAVPPGGGVEAGGGTSTTATASAATEVQPVAAPEPAAGTETGPQSPMSKGGAKGKSGSKLASPPGQSAGKTDRVSAKLPPTTRAHGAARVSANGAALARVAKTEANVAEAWQKVRGPSLEHGAQRGQGGRNGGPFADDADPGQGNGNNGNGNGNNGIGNAGAASPAGGPGPAGQEHGNSRAAPSEPGQQRAPVDPSSSSDAGLGHGKNPAPSTPDLLNEPVAADPAPGNGHASSGQGHAADAAAAAIAAEVLVVVPVPVELGVEEAPAYPVGEPAVPSDAAPGNGHGASGKANAADAAAVVEAVVVPVIVPVAADAAPGKGHAADPVAPDVTAPVVAPAAAAPAPIASSGAPAAPPATPVAPAKKPPKK